MMNMCRMDFRILIILIFVASGVICISFFDKNHVNKQNSPRWDAAFCGVTSGAILFAYVHFKGHQAYMAYTVLMFLVPNLS